jgi:hypothetical protein
MDENEYRSAYHSINTSRCVFEKSILTLNCQCRHAHKFNLAEREGIRCSDEQSQTRCSRFLNSVRQQARFALKLTDIVGNLLPHSKEIQVQKGALLGLDPERPNLPDTPIADISSLLEKAAREYGANLESLPYPEMVKSIVHHPARKRRRQRKPRKP